MCAKPSNACVYVSIHAPVKGATDVRYVTLSFIEPFQSTLP